MTSVSVLIPAYRPDWLDVCIASCLYQTHEIEEILIGDDCPTDAVRQVLRKWDNPKIKIFDNQPKGVPGSNVEMLLSKARGEFIKFLFDDDFMLPSSVETLVNACNASGAAFAAHRRYMIDGLGQDIAFNELFDDDIVYFDQHLLFNIMVNVGVNWIGEPSNVLFRSAALAACDQPFRQLGGCQINYNTDMACYLNITGEGRHGVCLNTKHSCFRIHQSQNTKTTNYGGVAFAEFDVMRRVGAQKGAITKEDFFVGIEMQKKCYADQLDSYPQFGPLLLLLEAVSYDEPLPIDFITAMREAYW